MKKLAMLVLSMFLCTAVLEAAKPIKAVISKTRGEVLVKIDDNSAWKKGYESMPLDENATLKTNWWGNVTLTLNDGSKISVKGNSQIKLNNLGDSDRTVEQQKGKSIFKINKMWGGKKFQCKTPVAVCSVRGTEFGVEVGDDNSSTFKVYSGLVDVMGGKDTITLNPNEKIDVKENIPMGAPTAFSASDNKEKGEIVKSAIAQNAGLEVSADMTKEAIQKAAADEMRLAEYQQGKTIVDAFGQRVRIQEYIVRTAVDQYKLVVLNERNARYDYFTNKQTFNTTLPTDLSVANKAWREWNDGAKTTTPSYYLTANESAASNTKDIVTWGYTGGHTTGATGSGAHFYNGYYFKINGNSKIAYNPTTAGGTANSTSDITWSVVGTNMAHSAFLTWWDANIVIDTPSGADKMHTSMDVANFGNGTSYKEQYYTITDLGKIASSSDYSKNGAYAYNQEMVLSGSEFTGTDGKIDICVEPKIFRDAGLIK
ncbi:MAG: FecR domain-containing protein [Elusimicrobia bacterium]|nr:FecR domain-containing protein [Candidatus Liberimonas magnetica]